FGDGCAPYRGGQAPPVGRAIPPEANGAARPTNPARIAAGLSSYRQRFVYPPQEGGSRGEDRLGNPRVAARLEPIRLGRARVIHPAAAARLTTRSDHRELVQRPAGPRPAGVSTREMSRDSERN